MTLPELETELRYARVRARHRQDGALIGADLALAKRVDAALAADRPSVTVAAEDLAEAVADARHALNCCGGEADESDYLQRLRETLSSIGVTPKDW